jgi:hypothetical protein
MRRSGTGNLSMDQNRTDRGIDAGFLQKSQKNQRKSVWKFSCQTKPESTGFAYFQITEKFKFPQRWLNALCPTMPAARDAYLREVKASMGGCRESRCCFCEGYESIFP